MRAPGMQSADRADRVRREFRPPNTNTEPVGNSKGKGRAERELLGAPSGGAD
jgi:hypothetical protein